MGNKCATLGSSKVVWDPRHPVASGSEREVFTGTCKGRAVTVIVAKKQGEMQLRREIEVLEQLGRHPHIVALIYSGSRLGAPYLALEGTQPFDLDILRRQYVFARKSVPFKLTRRLIDQLCSALDYMHSHQIIHRDVKTENILITSGYNAKLIDMGIACKIGTQETRWIWVLKSYHSPEMCQGSHTLGTEVDAWGLGLCLHQLYQHRWDLVDASKEVAVMRPDRPYISVPMEESLMEAMLGLLAYDPSKRWSTKMCQQKIPADVSRFRGSWHAPTATTGRPLTRQYLCQYKDSALAPSAYAAVVDSESKHLHGKTVEDLALRKEFNIILLLVDVPASTSKRRERQLEKIPKRDTVIVDGAWLYFGMPPKDNNEEAIASLKKAIFPTSTVSKDHIGRNLNFNVKAGLMTFSPAFDVFEFPDHIGKKAIIGSGVGDSDAQQLNLRDNFGLNLAGIVRVKSKETEWFPGPEATVDAGDLGLLVRYPCQDGTTEPTVTDEELRPLMSKDEFEEIMRQQARDVCGPPGPASGRPTQGVSGCTVLPEV